MLKLGVLAKDESNGDDRTLLEVITEVKRSGEDIFTREECTNLNVNVKDVVTVNLQPGRRVIIQRAQEGETAVYDAKQGASILASNQTGQVVADSPSRVAELEKKNEELQKKLDAATAKQTPNQGSTTAPTPSKPVVSPSASNLNPTGSTGAGMAGTNNLNKPKG